jgi:hypothetical protein
VYAANETLFQPVELPAITNENGCVVVTSVVMHDYDDQGVALNLVFLRQVITVGPNQAAMTIPDAQLHHVLGHINIAAGNYLNLATNQVATATNCGLVMRPAGTANHQTSIWMTANTLGTPTYAGGRLTFLIGGLRG